MVRTFPMEIPFRNCGLSPEVLHNFRMGILENYLVIWFQTKISGFFCQMVSTPDLVQLKGLWHSSAHVWRFDFWFSHLVLVRKIFSIVYVRLVKVILIALINCLVISGGFKQHILYFYVTIIENLMSSRGDTRSQRPDKEVFKGIWKLQNPMVARAACGTECYKSYRLRNFSMVATDISF